MNQNTLGKILLISLFAAFFIPLIIAMWILYGSNTLSSSSTSHGTLFQPPQELAYFSLQTNSGAKLEKQDLQRKWTLLYIGGTACNVQCEANLTKMQQVTFALGQTSETIQRIYIGLEDSKNKLAIEKLFIEYPQMQVYWFTSDQMYAAVPQFKNLSQHQIYIVNPLGQLMMLYPKHATLEGIKDDLKKLLKISKIG